MVAADDGFSPQVVPLSGTGTPTANADSAQPSAAAVTAPAAPPPPAPASSARDFLKALENAFGRLVTLKVVTVVGDVSVSGTGGDTVVAARPGSPVEAASTEVNLLDGHIINVFSPGFASTGATPTDGASTAGAPSGGSLQTFHQSQVEKSGDIMLRNLAELQKLASALATARR